MKVIDLLNKIANGEIPKRIIYDDKQWTYDEKIEDYITYDDSRIDWKYTIMEYINDEVEIIEDTFSGIKFYENGKETCSIDTKPSFTTKDLHIEEDKKIEKLEIVHNGSANAYALLDNWGTKCALTKHSKVMCDKINEIIDYINKENK